MPPLGLAVKPSLLSYRRRPSFALATRFDRMRAAQVQGMLAIFAADLIDSFIELSDFFRLYRIFKERILSMGIRGQVQENYSRGPVQLPFPE